MEQVDIMAFGAHPDDIEIGCGGTLIKLAEAGRSIALVDMARGEMATRGTVDDRGREARRAMEIMGARFRENLDLPDAHIHVDEGGKRKVVEVVRRYRPDLVLVPYCRDRHPDHYRTSEVVYEGLFLAGLERYDTGQEAYRPPRIVYFMQWNEFEPTFIVDITDQYDRKMEAIYAYETQFKPEDDFYKQTKLTSREYNWSLHSRMAYYGSLIGVRYGEGFLLRGHLAVGDLFELSFSSF